MAGPTAFWAPVHRVLQRWNPANQGFPPNAAPGMEFLSAGIQDHRLPYNQFNTPGASVTTGAGVLGWYGTQNPMVANFVPSAIATANIAALQNVTNGTAMTLVSSSGSGITVLSASAPALLYPGGLISLAGTAGAGSLTAGCVIDSIPTYWRFGASGSFTTVFYNRSTCVGRGVSITGVSGGAGGNFLIKGYDAYGYAMSQLLTVGAGAVTANTTKAFKVVTSVVPQFTDAHNYSVGTADIFGFGILATYFGDVDVFWNSAAITSSTGFVTADTTTPATTTTGDVRGTYAVQSASDGTKRLQMFVTPTLGGLVTNPTTGLFGQPQV